MTHATPFVIDAVVADSERLALTAAAAQLGEALEAASGARWDVEVRFRDTLAAVAAPEPSTVIVASLLPELPAERGSLAAIEARLRAQLDGLPPGIPVLLCTIFRHVAAPPDNLPDDAPETQPLLRERIRRLDLLAIDLSHDTGAFVVDLDRTFTHFGARTLATDHRLGGALAAEVAAHAIVTGILNAGIDAVVPRDVQERAGELQGPLRDVLAFVAPRLSRA